MKNRYAFPLAVILSAALVGTALSLILTRFIDFRPGEKAAAGALAPSGPEGGGVVFNPPDPQSAPPDIRDAVMLGYNILTETRKYAPKYVGNKLTCSNCHFKAGMAGGGKNGSISLVGVAATYPKFKKRHHYSVDLVTRTNDCFERSMKGKPLPPDSREMTAVITYYQWIAKGLPIYSDIPWLGIKPLRSSHVPDASRGKQVFAQKCALCHGPAGQGTQAGPPLWGDGSFSDGAGMHRPDIFAAFAENNMPKGNPDLSPEDALDVAAFVAKQPRPRFRPEKG